MAWRDFKGYTQQELASKAGVSVSTISRAERDPESDMQPSIARKIEEALGVEPFALSSLAPSMQNEQLQEISRFLDALDTIARTPVPGEMLIAYNDKSSDGIAETFVDWVLSQKSSNPEVSQHLFLPDVDQLRDGLILAETIANELQRRYDEEEEQYESDRQFHQ